MKRIFTLCLIVCSVIKCEAQTDTTGKNSRPDTIRVGGMIIIRKPGTNQREYKRDNEYRMRNRHSSKPSNVSTTFLAIENSLYQF